MFYLYNHAGQLMYQYEPGLSQATNFIHPGTRQIADNAYLLLSMHGVVSFDVNPGGKGAGLACGIRQGNLRRMTRPVRREIGGAQFGTRRA